MPRGRVAWYSPELGHGFLVPEDGGPNAFVRREDIKAGEGETLENNDRVSYEVFQGREGLEGEGRFRFGAEHDSLSGRADALERLMVQEATSGHTVWASFDWVTQVDLDVALKQQEELAKFIDARQLVVKTAVLEAVLDNWPPAMQRQLQTRYSGTMWLSEAGLVLSRFTPLQPS